MLKSKMADFRYYVIPNHSKSKSRPYKGEQLLTLRDLSDSPLGGNELEVGESKQPRISFTKYFI
jgi:hypothetical protein